MEIPNLKDLLKLITPAKGMGRKNAGTAVNGSPGDESNEIPDYEGEKILFNADIDEIGPAKMLIEIRKMSHRCLTETEMDQQLAVETLTNWLNESLYARKRF